MRIVLVPALLAALALTAPAFAAQESYSNLVNVSYPGSNGVTLNAFLARPAGKGPFPAVIMIHEWWGLRSDIVSKAQLLSERGYVVAAVDVFRGKNTTSVPGAILLVSSHKREQILSDLDSAWRWLSVMPEVRKDRIGITGFCFGGTWSLNYSLVNPKIAATAVFYGSGITTNAAELKALTHPVLGIFGGKDRLLPVSRVLAFSNSLAAAGVPAEIVIYPGEEHAFVKGPESIRTNRNQKDAWDRLAGYFNRTLKKR